VFASKEEVAKRLARSLSAAEEEAAELLLELATSMVAEAVGKDDAWAEQLDPVPKVLRLVTLEATARAMANPEGLSSFEERLGAHSYSKSFRAQAEGAGLMLTKQERLMVRRVVRGSNSASPRVDSLASDLDPVVGS
jgi:hypothetical protein